MNNKLQKTIEILTNHFTKHNLKFEFKTKNIKLILNIFNPQNINDEKLFHIINDNLNFEFTFNCTIDKQNHLQIIFEF